MNKSREKLLLILTAGVFLFFIADKVVIGPMFETWKQRSTDIDVLREDLDRGEYLVSRQARYEADWGSMKEESLLSDFSSAEKETLTAIDRWASQSRFSVSMLRPTWLDGDDEVAEGARKLEIRLSGTGDMRSITRFLYEMERDALAVKVEDVEITARDEKGRELSLDVRMTGLVLAGEGEPS